MDGTNRYGIIRSKLGWPAGITLDIDAKRVYWVDSRYDYIETTTYDGLHRYALVLVKNIPSWKFTQMYYDFAEMHCDFTVVLYSSYGYQPLKHDAAMIFFFKTP